MPHDSAPSFSELAFARKPKVLAAMLLKRFHRVEWFSNVGEGNPRDHCIARHFSWRKALSSFTDKSWPDHKIWAQVDARVKNSDQSKFWKSVSSFADKVGAFQSIRRKKYYSSYAKKIAYMQITHCAVFFYGSLLAQHHEGIAYFGEKLAFFLEGHWPCGYAGRFPKGHLVVF